MERIVYTMTSTIPTFHHPTNFAAFYGFSLQPSAVEFTVQRIEHCLPDTSIRLPLYRTSYFTIFLFEQVEGNYSIDHLTYSVQNYSLCITSPGRLKSCEVAYPCRGYMITISELFFKKYLSAYPDLSYLITEAVPVIHLSALLFAEFAAISQQMLLENLRGLFHEEVISGLLIAFLYKAKRSGLHEYQDSPPLPKSTVDTFRQMMEQHWIELTEGKREQMPRTRDYAEWLHLHPKYFSRLIRAQTGDTPRALIRQKQIHQAQSLLVRTTLTVKEIAYQLGFSEPGHFYRVFRKHTGYTPVQYRQQSQ
ncbi:MAG: helix-turn-helix domain-containing protein [Tunicatimonas sp.]|uniref:helix-turn-helix domain-containing protein n=1 Tax=Tunicatimonas sp. TaxID=1940096 RepID=UPI003C761CC9